MATAFWPRRISQPAGNRNLGSTANSRCPLVRLEQSTQLLLAANVSERNRVGRLCLATPIGFGYYQHLILLTLMRQLGVVVLQELPDEEIQVSFAKDHEVIQALLLDGLNERFHKGVRV